MLDATKAYDFTIRFGEETDSLDLEGRVVASSEVRPTRADVEQSCPLHRPDRTGAACLLRAQSRRPARLRLARAGKEVELKSRSVTIHELQIRHPRESGTQRTRTGFRFRGNDEISEITLSATVSKGTYIRSLARDIPTRSKPSPRHPCSGVRERVRSARSGDFAGLSARCR